MKKRLSDLLNAPKPAKDLSPKSIKDYEKLEEIYGLYLMKQWFTMCNQIREYDEFTFFRDILIFCRHRYKSDSYISGIYWHLFELYFETITI